MEALTALVAAAAIFFFLAYLVRARALTPSEARLRYLTPLREQGDPRHREAGVLRRSSSSIPFLRRLLDTNGYTERWSRDLDRAGLRLRPGEYFFLRLLMATCVMILFAVLGQSPLPIIIGVAAAAVVFMLPSYWIRFRIQRRIAAINSQLVETITLVANGLRAGFAFAQSLEVTAQRVGPPMSVEINRVLLDINLGSTLEEALLAMNERVDSDDVDMVVTAILIQRKSGGNLAEVLDAVTETMRDRERVTGEIKTLTSQQRLTAWILALWPVGLGLIFFAINPSMMQLMWTTTVGMFLLVIWFMLTALAAFTYSRILAIDI
jgi:tight adherence protein B